MATYNYEDLGPERFQQLCQTLLAQVFPRVTCMPIGMADGGRDAVVSTRGVDTLVFQVKFRRRTPLANSTMPDMLEWLQQAIEPELPKVMRLIRKGMKRYVILTNATSSSHPDKGTRDLMLAWLVERIPVEVDVWWRDDLDRRIEPLWELKRVYGLLEAPRNSDSLLRAMVSGQLNVTQSSVTPSAGARITAIQKFLGTQFDRDSVIRFKEAELPRQPLLGSYLDIGAELQVQASEVRRLAGHLRMLRRTPESTNQRYYQDAYYRQGNLAAAGLLLQLAGTPEFKNTVIEGAPGQGKSTLVQYVCQVHRARLLGRSDLQLRTVPLEYRSSPILLPFRTDLRDLAAWLRGDNPFRSDDEMLGSYPRSVEGFIAALVYEGSGGSSFTVDDFDEIVAETPALLAFDGLDEVAEIESRTRVVEQISEFSARMQEVAQELRIVVTSRPSAFSASPRFPAERFSYLNLANLSEALIFDYTKTWAKTRGIDADGARDLMKTLAEKLHQSHIADLARNSMQLAILLWLLYQQADSLPDQRTSLYEQYIKTFLNREAGKSQVIRLHRGIVVQLHAYLAWILQARAESGSSQGNMGVAEIKGLAREYLRSLGYSDAGLKIVDELFELMVDRVGVIVSRVQGSYEFEVQPLREYFAALHLYETARYSPAGREVSGTKSDRFDAMARNPYWQNVTRFYVGFFDKGELSHLVDQFNNMFEHGDYSRVTYPRVLAANVLSDRIFYQSPGKGQKLAAQIVSRPIGWLALSSGDSGNRFSLPNDSGGNEVIRLGKQQLEGALPAHASEIVRVLSGHCAGTELRDWWRQRLPERASPAWDQWMAIGAGLNVLGELGDSEILRIFSAEAGDLLDYGYIFKGGLTVLALTQPTIGENLVKYVKMGIRPIFRNWRTDNPLDVSCVAIFEFSPEIALDAVARTRAQAAKLSTPDILAPFAELNNEMARLGRTRLRHSNLLDRLIRKHLGNCWLADRQAFIQYVTHGNSMPGAEDNLLDDIQGYREKPFYLALSTALARKDDLAWWLDQISQASSSDNIQFLAVLLLCYASERSIAACLPVLSASVRTWEIARIAGAFEVVRMLDLRRPHLNVAKIDLGDCDPVTRAFVGVRSRMDQRVRILDQAAGDLSDIRLGTYVADAMVRACQSRMMHSGRWMGCRDAAKHSANPIQIPLGSTSAVPYGQVSKQLEDRIIVEILDDLIHYPVSLARMADADGSHRLAGRAVPLARTAVGDQWFDQPQPF